MNEYPFEQLSDSGLLWLINRQVFHPRGFALTLLTDDDGKATGWFLDGDGTEVWAFEADVDDEYFQRAERTFQEARPEYPWNT